MPLKDRDAHRKHLNDRYANEPGHKQRVKARAQAYYVANRDGINEKRRIDPNKVRLNKSRALRFRTGATLEDKERLLVEQDWRCAACLADLIEATDRGIHLDHSHRTKKIRGVLCHGCNVALGMVDDNPDRLHMLIAYLQKHK